jgi:hypothetical protein
LANGLCAGDIQSKELLEPESWGIQGGDNPTQACPPIGSFTLTIMATGAAVPEPETALFLLGTPCLFLRRRR